MGHLPAGVPRLLRQPVDAHLGFRVFRWCLARLDCQGYLHLQWQRVMSFRHAGGLTAAESEDWLQQPCC